MTEHCPDHAHVERSLGRLEERTERIEDRQITMDGKLDKLVLNGVATTAKEATIEKERRWMHWLLVSAAGAAVIIIVQAFLPGILKAIAGLVK